MNRIPQIEIKTVDDLKYLLKAITLINLSLDAVSDMAGNNSNNERYIIYEEYHGKALQFIKEFREYYYGE